MPSAAYRTHLGISSCADDKLVIRSRPRVCGKRLAGCHSWEGGARLFNSLTRFRSHDVLLDAVSITRQSPPYLREFAGASVATLSFGSFFLPVVIG